ncbi:hypothetical protein Dimus_013978 [Dionaea muscipula]
MASAARAVLCELQPQKPSVPARTRAPESSSPDQVKIILQPRLCTLRSFASDRGAGVIWTRKDGGDGRDNLSPFLTNLYEYIESCKKSQDFETISGRLAMMIFAATVSEEFVTGNSVFRKMDLQGIAQAAGVGLGAVACAALFAWFSAARSKVGRMFTLSCNSFIDSFIDNIVDSLFYDTDPSEWSD